MDTKPDELRRRAMAWLASDNGKALERLMERLQSDATVDQGEFEIDESPNPE